MPLCTCGRPLVPTRRFDTEMVPTITRRETINGKPVWGRELLERRCDTYRSGLGCPTCGAFYPESAESVAWD